MSQTVACPPLEVLKDLIRGKLEDPQFSEYVLHLEACPSCQERAGTITPEDTLVESLRAETSTDSIARQVPRPLVEKIKKLAASKAEVSQETIGLAGDATPADGPDIGFLAPPQEADEIGRLGNYRILKVLGQGGMGMVFLGHDPHLDRRVAVKVMLPKVAANEAAKQRFLREARTVARIRSDHIVSIFQVGEDRGVPYIAMEFLEGMPLDAFLASGRKPTVSQILRIGRDIAKGLAAAHEQGLIHRDIKPGNLWLDQGNAGRVKILDFGLARAEKDDIHLTQSGIIVGTPAYMAPEQARGEKTVDARADLFSLGVVLYRLCAGDIPFKGETTMGVLLALAMNEPPAPHQVDDKVPVPLSELIMQLLAKDPAKRPQTARDVLLRFGEVEKAWRDSTGPADATLNLAQTAPAPADSGPQPGLATQLHEAQRAAAAPVQLSPSRRRRFGPVAVAVAGLLLAALAYGVYVLTFRTENGTLVVEVDDDADVRFKQGKLEVYDEAGKLKYTLSPSEKNKTLPPGKYLVKVVGSDGLKIDTDRFEIARGGRASVRVSMEQVVAVGPGRVKVKETANPVVPASTFALRFDGQVQGIPPIPVALELSKPFTVEAYAAVEPGAAGSLLIHSVNNMNLRFTGGKAEFNLRGQERNSWTANSVGVPVVPKQWIHIAGVHTGKEILLFVNGKPAGSKNVEKNPPHAGAIALGFGQRFPGLLRELRISRTARYLKEFTPAPLFEPDADTIALYHCDEGSGDKLVDSSGNGHHGKIVGATWVQVAGASADPDRKAAEWVLSVGGKLDQVTVGNKSHPVKNRADLPKEPFRIRSAKLYFLNVKDQDLAVFEGCTELNHLVLSGTPINDSALANLRDCRNLDFINLSSTKVTDAGLAHLQNCTKLTQIHLVNTPITDKGLEIFKDRDLRALSLSGTGVTEAGLALFAHCRKLFKLFLENTKTTDKGLAHFRNAKELTQLNIGGTQVTDAGLADFPAGKYLTSLVLARTEIGDGCIDALSGFRKLKVLNVAKTNLTPAGVKKLAAALPQCHIEWDGGIIQPTVPGSARPSPLDGWRRATIPAEALKKAGNGDPAKAPPELVAVLGDATLGKLKLGISGDGQRIYGRYSNDRTVRIWDPATGRLLLSKQVWGPNVHRPGKRLVLRIFLQKKFTVLDALTLETAFEIGTPGKTLASLNQEGTRAVIYPYPGEAPKIEILDFAVSKEVPVHTLTADFHSIKKAVFIPDGRVAVLEGSGRVTLLDADTGKQVLRFAARNNAFDLDYDAAGKRICVLLGEYLHREPKLGRGQVAQVFDAATGKLVHEVDLPFVTSMVLSPYGSTLVTETLGTVQPGSFDRGKEKDVSTIIVWDLATGKRTHQWLLPFAEVEVAFAPDGRHILTGNADGSIYVFRLAEATASADPDRRAAERVLSLGGTVKVEGSKEAIKAVAALPQEPFTLVDVDLVNKQATDQDLELFRGLAGLKNLRLYDTKVGDAGMVHLKDLRSLVDLNVGAVRLTDAGLRHLEELDGLTHLNLGPSLVTDAGLARLGKLRRLTFLSLYQAKVTDVGLAHLKNHPDLQTLHLHLNDISDAGLVHLHDLKILTFLNVGATKVGAKGVAALQAALPRCRIQWDGGTIEPRKAGK